MDERELEPEGEPATELEWQPPDEELDRVLVAHDGESEPGSAERET